MQIKRDNSLSEPFNVCNGVRQGNVLSPFLFNVYLDDLLGDRRDSGAGAKIGNMFLGVWRTLMIPCLFLLLRLVYKK